MIDMNKSISKTIKTGKVLFGTKHAINNAKVGKAKLIIVAANCSQETRADLQYYCGLSRIPMIIYNGNSIELGAVCGKSYMVSALTVKEQGDSEILKLAEATNV